jgi:hypothetical protein
MGVHALTPIVNDVVGQQTPWPTDMVKMKSKLTDRFLQSIKPVPTGKRITYWDTSVDGFAIRVRSYGGFSVTV